jgi:hypothetical protein
MATETSAIKAGDHRLPLLILAGVVGVVATVYLGLGLLAGEGQHLILPLDDTYIHFQYARMIAEGYPFRYSPSDPPTSGSTSFLYPFVLAIGYKLGFTGLNLAWWAVGIGVAAWIGSAWMMYLILCQMSETYGLPLIIACAFALMGSQAFGFVSGMETGHFVLFVLSSLYAIQRQAFRTGCGLGALVALIRPEGVVIVIGMIAYWTITRRRVSVWFLLPLIAIAAQPFLNWVLTGSISATGIQAKSFLYDDPLQIQRVAGQITLFFLTIWVQFFTGLDIDRIYYQTGLLLLIPAVYFLWAIRRPRVRTTALLLLVWIVGLAASLSVLDTAFWHFKRYQQVIYALLFVMAGWGILRLKRRYFRWILAPLILIGSIPTTITFSIYYYGNSYEVGRLNYTMAQYLVANTPPNATIGVHDAGMITYLTQRSHLDVVGLTSPRMAVAWRKGAGMLYELLQESPKRPDWFAIYALAYLQDTRLFANVIQPFPSPSLVRNVATAGPQFVMKPDWTGVENAQKPHSRYILDAAQSLQWLDSVNVASPTSERQHLYSVQFLPGFIGYSTELYDLPYAGCIRTMPPAPIPDCQILDGGRRITGRESFTINTPTPTDLLWIIRVHPREAALLHIEINGQFYAERYQPGDLGGQWIEIPIWISTDRVTSPQTRLAVQVREGTYMPYTHWVYSGYTPQPEPPTTAYFGVGVGVGQVELTQTTDTLTLQARWRIDERFKSRSRTDAKVFVHLYPAENLAHPPVAQYDSRPGQGTLPPANWLPGTLTDSYSITLPKTPGRYTVALGMYNPTGGQRDQITLNPEAASPFTVNDQRLIVGGITVP